MFYSLKLKNKEMEAETKQVQEQVKFLRTATNSVAAGIAAGATEYINLNTIYSIFGKNFNTISVNVTSTEAITLILDGQEVQYIQGNGGTYAFDWEFGIIYSTIAIKNEDGAGTISQNEIKITLGRTGK